MQDEIEVTGIVLSQMPVGEADRRIILLTKELGRISCFARGARKPTNHLVGATRPFLFGTFYLYPGKESYSLHKAEIKEYFDAFSSDMEASFYGCYFLELSSYFTRENTDCTKELSLVYYGLKALLNEKLDRRLTRFVFELRMLSINGLVPDFQVCPKCQKEYTQGFFKKSIMQCVCNDCETEGVYPLNKSALYAIRYVLSTELKKLFLFKVTDEVLKQFGDVTTLLYDRNVERLLPTRDMLFTMIQ